MLTSIPTAMKVEYQQEDLATVLPEVIPMLQAHATEVGAFNELPHLKPDFERYAFIEAAGAYRAFTARDAGVLVGYAGFFVEPNLHCVDIITANADLIYVQRSHRGIAAQFMAWCDNQLRLEKVSGVYHHVPVTRDFTRALYRLGYSPSENIFFRKL